MDNACKQPSSSGVITTVPMGYSHYPDAPVAPSSAFARKAFLGAKSCGSKLPATPWECTGCQSAEASASASAVATSQEHGSQKKRKAARPVAITTGGSWPKHKPHDSACSPDLPASCNSSASTSDDFVLSWSQSYAASRFLSRRSSLDSELGQSSFDGHLLCQEQMAEDESNHACGTSYSSSSSASELGMPPRLQLHLLFQQAPHSGPLKCSQCRQQAACVKYERQCASPVIPEYHV